RNAQLHFSAGADFTPQTQVGADLNGALAHRRQPPVARASAAQVFRLDALAVVADPQPKLAGAIGDLRLDAFRLRVPEGIAERLAGNAMDVLADNRVQVARRTFDRHPKQRGALLPVGVVELFGQGRDRLRQFVANDRGRTQILNGVAAFDEGLVRPVE